MNRILSRTWLCALASLLGGLAVAAEAPLSGEARFNRTCAKCHARGLNGAPRVGDKAAWAPFLQKGQDVVTARAWVGVGDMPPRGGAGDELGLGELARTVVYMARQGGASWKDPTPQRLARIEAEAARLPPPPKPN
ncbi:MAG TPA: c-type cytochrome [Rubrivivax sp.]|nr:c-type cytochrome [Rubrivivax sp.]